MAGDWSFFVCTIITLVIGQVRQTWIGHWRQLACRDKVLCANRELLVVDNVTAIQYRKFRFRIDHIQNHARHDSDNEDNCNYANESAKLRCVSRGIADCKRGSNCYPSQATHNSAE